MSFFVQYNQRKLVVPIKLLVMLSNTVKQLFKLSLKMKSTDNTKPKIEKPDDLLKMTVYLFGLRLSCDKF